MSDFVGKRSVSPAALSGDHGLLDAYLTGDPYLAFAKQAGLAPEDATKAIRKAERERCNSVVLGILSGEAMAGRTGPGLHRLKPGYW